MLKLKETKSFEGRFASFLLIQNLQRVLIKCKNGYNMSKVSFIDSSIKKTSIYKMAIIRNFAHTFWMLSCIFTRSLEPLIKI